MFRSAILAVSRNRRVEQLVTATPLTRGIVRRFVAGEDTEDAVRVARELVGQGLAVSLDFLGEDSTDASVASATRDAYLTVLKALSSAELTPSAEVSVKLSALGQLLDQSMALEHARAICEAAESAGTAVTLDMEDHTTTDSTLEVLDALRTDFPRTGVALQAYLRRTEADCRDLAYAGSRVRLCKGAYAEPESVAYQAPWHVDRSYARCLNILLAGDGYPMFATHDPRLVAIAEERAKWYDRTPDTFEFQMLYGVRPDEQHRLRGDGYTVRVYVPYGDAWYPYLMRRLAERPANLTFFLRALASRA
ncbi:MAG TPA: proline dehydrogenase family protein [Cryptosporangiaceae bacterium]|nr:proline dehydrogenase family protein [Cryptosporangiaceae bacterium]